MNIFSDKVLRVTLALTFVSLMSLNTAWAGKNPLDEEAPKTSATQSSQIKQQPGDSTNRSVSSELDPDNNNNNIIEKKNKIEGKLVSLFTDQAADTERDILLGFGFLIWEKLGWREKVNLASVSRGIRKATDRWAKQLDERVQGKFFRGVTVLPDPIKSWTAFLFHRHYMENFSHLDLSQLTAANKLELEEFADIYETLGEESMGAFIRIQKGEIDPTENISWETSVRILKGEIEPTEKVFRLRKSDVLSKRPLPLEHELGRCINRKNGLERLTDFRWSFVDNRYQRASTANEIVYLLIELAKLYKTPVLAARQFERLSWEKGEWKKGEGERVLERIWSYKNPTTALSIAIRFALCEPFLIRDVKAVVDDNGAMDLVRYKKWLKILNEYLHNNDIERPIGSGQFELLDDDPTARDLELTAEAHFQLGKEAYDDAKKKFSEESPSFNKKKAFKTATILAKKYFKKAVSLSGRRLEFLEDAATEKELLFAAESNYRVGRHSSESESEERKQFFEKALSLHNRRLELLGDAVTVKDLELAAKRNEKCGNIKDAISLYKRSGNREAVKQLSYLKRFTN